MGPKRKPADDEPRPIRTRTRGSKPTSRRWSAPRSKASPSIRRAPLRHWSASSTRTRTSSAGRI